LSITSARIGLRQKPHLRRH